MINSLHFFGFETEKLYIFNKRGDMGLAKYIEINNFYKDVCDGFQKYDEWSIFWIGISDLKLLTSCIDYATNQPATIHYEE